ncbi:MAG: hypothetical protein CVU05_02515 [Bacteroidetes bacterium HGW-Bacteroidetes-21]|jgi:hypothetical protein|nr:MAG: hypothetical protein CVU05_02515 [Bacteroidetes bacterium HGW-Bacteroidetes-21]
MKTIFALVIIAFLAKEMSSQNEIISLDLPVEYTASEMHYRTGIASDSDNNLWVAFQYKGLAKYDGSSWTLYNTSNSQIPNDTILCLYIYNNVVYAGTPHGLISFNGTVWSTATMANGLAGSQINGIFADGQSLIVTTEQHLSIRNGGVWTNYLIPNSNFGAGTFFDYLNFHTPIIKDASGNIWIGRYDAGLLRFNGSVWESVKYNTTFLVRPRALIMDSNDNIWVGTSSTTFIYNGDSLVRTNQLYEDWMGVLPVQISSFAENSDGEIFFGSNVYQYLLNDELQTIQLSFAGGFGLLCCFNNGSYKVIHATSDVTKFYSFYSIYYNDYGDLYKPGTYKYLDINQVKAGFGNRGSFFWDLAGSPKYEVPKGSGKHSLFCGGLWIGGLDANDHIHFSGATFQQDGYDYFPGPLKTSSGSGYTDTTACLPYNRIWKINKTEIDNFRQWFADGSLGTGNHIIPEVIANWPAHGDDLSGYDYYLAPFVDTDSNGVYEPAHGDYPKIRGNQMLWWVFNDKLAPHGEFDGLPMGVEVRASAYAYGCDTLNDSTNAINYTTFMHYEIINRTTYTYNNCFVGIFNDADLGDHSDDFVGSNVGLNSFYVYNGDECDGDGNGKTYGLNPPCQSIVVLNGPWAPENDGLDNDHDGDIDEMWESTGMSGFTYFNNSSSALGNPVTAEDGYNYLNASWRDGSHLQYGETGYNTGGVNCQYMFPGRPTTDPYGWGTGGIPQEDWSEESENNSPGDRRGLASMGPFAWTPGEIQYIDIAYVWSRADSGGVHAGVSKNQEETADVIAWYKNGGTMPWITGGNFPNCDPIQNTVYQNELTSSSFFLHPNPASDKVMVSSSLPNDNYSIELINYSGQKVAQYQGKGNTKLDISGFAKGIYIVRVIGRQQIESRKLIIE